MSVFCKAKASEIQQPVKRQMAKRQRSREASATAPRGLISPSLNNRSNSLAVSTLACPFPDTFIGKLISLLVSTWAKLFVYSLLTPASCLLPSAYLNYQINFA